MGPDTKFVTSLRPAWNKGSSFTHDERNQLGIRGLYPSGGPISLQVKVDSTMEHVRSITRPLDKYIYLHTIQDCDETLYHACICQHLIELMPLIYTPTVGEACLQWSRIYRQSIRGVYISLDDRGKVADILRNYPEKNIEAIVVTDGEAILGLGDLGTNGMGIPVGKLALYTGCAGIHPSRCLPVMIDVGTNNKSLLKDAAYLGVRQQRARGQKYYDLINEFISACKRSYGQQVLIQFEDFGNATAFELLRRHRLSACCFNDDVQGTAAVVLAGLFTAVKLTTLQNLSDHTILFYGAGAAGVGIADLIALAMVKENSRLSLTEAKQKIWLMDSKGLVILGRKFGKDTHKVPYAHNLPYEKFDVKNLIDVIKNIRPTILIGVSAQAGAFNQSVCHQMAQINRSPIIFSLSNPTALCECTPENAYHWTNGRCIFSSGSPFSSVTLPSGEFFRPGQGNNAYIFPGVGLAAIIAGAQCITDDDFYVAAQALANEVSSTDIDVGAVYPSLSRLREVSVSIAVAVIEQMICTERATKPLPQAGSECKHQLIDICHSAMYTPSYDRDNHNNPMKSNLKSRL